MGDTVEVRKTMTKRRLGDFFWFILPAIAFLLVIVVFPLVYSFYVSLIGWYPIKPMLGKPFVGLANYVKVLTEPDVWNALKVTFLFTGGVVGVQLLIGLGLALVLSKNICGVRAIRSILLIPMAATPVAVGISWRYMFNEDFGVINYYLRKIGFSTYAWLSSATSALPAVMVIDIWQWTPFMFLIILAGLQSLPTEMFEAARVEGASEWKIFRFITLPMLKRVILIALLLRTIDAIRVFDIIYAATRGGPGVATESLSVYIYRLGFRYFYTSEAAALSFVFVAITTLICTALISALRK